MAKRQKNTSYETVRAEKGTLVVSVSASGQAASAGIMPVNTQVSGVVKTVYVSNNDAVSTGQKIAEIDLDQSSQQRQAQTWSVYLSAKNTLDASSATLYTLQSQMFVANQKFMNDAVAGGKAKDDPVYIEENANWLAAEASYKNQQNVISQAQAAVDNVWLSYQQNSSVITAPTSGTISGLTLRQGIILASLQGSAASSGTTTTSSSQKVAVIKVNSTPSVSVNLSEIDAPKVKVGDKATLTFDALPAKTFTGRVFSIDTAGSVNSGVTTYPAMIVLDVPSSSILPNMSATANIIVDTVNNALLVPSSAVQSQNDQFYLRILKNGTVQQVPIEVGKSSDTQAQILSGISEGDEVVTSLPSSQRGPQNASPFGTFRGFGGGLRPGGGGGGR